MTKLLGRAASTVACVAFMGVATFDFGSDPNLLDVRSDVVSISEVRPPTPASESTNESQKRKLKKGKKTEPIVKARPHLAFSAGRLPTPAEARIVGWRLAKARGWAGMKGQPKKQWTCLVSLWNRESGWKVWADNPASDAYGVPQALPGWKMAKMGRDWRWNPWTQVRWGLWYIEDRYHTPCGAWLHFLAHYPPGWY